MNDEVKVRFGQTKEYHKEYREKNKEKRNQYKREWYAKNKERALQYDKEYKSARPGLIWKYMKKYLNNNPEKKAAHYLVKQAIKKGELIRMPCEVCGNVKSDAHHDNYSKPLDVRWLCRKHHKEHHQSILLQSKSENI